MKDLTLEKRFAEHLRAFYDKWGQFQSFLGAETEYLDREFWELERTLIDYFHEKGYYVHSEDLSEYMTREITFEDLIEYGKERVREAVK